MGGAHPSSIGMLCKPTYQIPLPLPLRGRIFLNWWWFNNFAAELGVHSLGGVSYIPWQELTKERSHLWCPSPKEWSPNKNFVGTIAPSGYVPTLHVRYFYRSKPCVPPLWDDYALSRRSWVYKPLHSRFSMDVHGTRMGASRGQLEVPTPACALESPNPNSLFHYHRGKGVPQTPSPWLSLFFLPHNSHK